MLLSMGKYAEWRIVEFFLRHPNARVYVNELAKELGLTKLKEKKAKQIDEKIKEQEDSAATGMGMIFD